MSTASTIETVRVIDIALACPELPIVEGSGKAKVVLWPGNGATYRTFQVIDLSAGDRTIALKHPSDAVYYVVAGSGSVLNTATGESQKLVEGAMVHIDAGDSYRLINGGARDCRLIGGPCPADPALYAHLEHGAK